MACGKKDILGCITDPIKDIIKTPIEKGGELVAGGAVKAFSDAIGAATEATLKALNGVWLNINVEEPGTPAESIHGATSWLVGYVAVASLLIAAIKMALDRRGEPMKQAFLGMWKVLLVGGLAVPVVTALNAASDAYARDIYKKSELGETANDILGVIGLTQPGLIIVFGLLVMLSSVVQICLMYIRIGVLIMLIGTLPLAAVSSMTGWGEGWWKKHIGWLGAWLLYKPAAALIIYSATAMTNNPGNKDKLDTTIAGMGMLILAVFALPALLKLIVPATAALGGTSGGTVALNAAGNMASGAVSIASGSMGGGGGGGGSSSGGGGGSGSGAKGESGPKGSPSAGAGESAPSGGGASAPSAGGAGGSGAAGASGSGASGAAGAAGSAAGGAATAGATVAVQAAAVAAQTTIAAASEVTNSLDDNDGMKGHNQ
ncbi:hypothetical protein [Streptomyces sp. NPDC005955]|uniref:hypothetical protein n=1 Tax=Streptomyces sp. NPDC005955 TaxID=3364738 RepID=UPI0036819182